MSVVYRAPAKGVYIDIDVVVGNRVKLQQPRLCSSRAPRSSTEHRRASLLPPQ